LLSFFRSRRHGHQSLRLTRSGDHGFLVTRWLHRSIPPIALLLFGQGYITAGLTGGAMKE